MDQGGTSFFELCREFGLTPTAEVSALLGGASAVQRFREQRSTEQWSKAGPPPAAVSRSSLLLAVAVRDVRMADALGAGLGSLELALDVDSAQLADLVRNAEPLEDVAVRPTCREALACYAELFGSARPLDPIGIGHGIVTNPLGGTILDDLRGAGIDAGAVSLAVGRLMGARYLVDHSFWPVAERVIGRALALAKRSIGVEELRSSLLLIAYGQEGERDAESSAGLARSELDRDGAFASTAKSWIVPRERASSPIEPSIRSARSGWLARTQCSR